tara:strand:+ start:826 stop:1137 length:312 start_codon:yes stop_codon:yes gene_type:complete
MGLELRKKNETPAEAAQREIEKSKRNIKRQEKILANITKKEIKVWQGTERLASPGAKSPEEQEFQSKQKKSMDFGKGGKVTKKNPKRKASGGKVTKKRTKKKA